ncbi:MAG TPA: hypothetical protein VGP53_11360 [Acidimicrobiales bacterium]|nr:hypothetical protein [Acidimicrobiales bacterium]
MERRATDTQPLPVVETVAAPAALPVEPEGQPPPASPQGRRDLTPIVLGLLAVAAVLAIGLSVLALSRRDQPATPLDPVGADTAATTVPTSSPPTSVDPPPTTAGTVATTRATPAPNATTAGTTARSGGDGKDKGGRRRD